ncbi:GNAT family N-acetyltransferase [Rhodophyticola sp. MJ-SS7]|nr:GNAT family N-acetyltransferase [Rhodophyticola sp. MJ-SS7]
MSPAIHPAAPDAPELGDLFQRHLTLMRASSPACSVHAMEPGDLAAAGVRFFVIREGDTTLAMGALKHIGPGHAELKSMHVVEEARGRGLARMLLCHLVEVAHAEGLARLSLETGVQPAFAPARALYLSEGFEECEPFEGYAPDPNSVFMTRLL